MGLMSDSGGYVGPPKKDVPFNCLFSTGEKDMLGVLAQTMRSSQAQVVRQLVVNAYLMSCEGQPRCASGMGCLVAHLHHRQGQEPHMSAAPSGAIGGGRGLAG